MSEQTQKTVSIVIATNRRLVKVRRCIKSIMDNTAAPFEIILIDNDPLKSALALVSDFPVIKYKCPEESLGVAAARNYGINHSENDYVLIIDDDAYVTEDVVSKAFKVFDGDNLAAAVALRIEDVNTKVAYHRCDPCKACPGGGGVFLRSALKTVGPQRSEFRFGAEEIDWAVRAYNAGFRIRYARDATVYHDPDHRSNEGTKFPNYKLRHTLRSRLMYLFYNFRWRTVIVHSFRVVASFVVAGVRQGSVAPVIQGVLGALEGCWRTRAQRVVVRPEVEEFYTSPNECEDEYSIPYWRKICAAIRTSL